MIFIRSLAFNLAFYLWTTFVLVVSIPLLVGPVRLIVHAHIVWTAGVVKLLAIAGIKVEFRGVERLPEPPFLIASKHQSAFDTLIYHAIIWNPAAVVKRELTWIPLYGWHIRRVGSIAIDRGGRDKAVRRMLRKAKALRDRGRVILIFPEGTRTAPGQRKPYLPGVAGLYRQLKVPVYPVALNSGLFWPRRRFMRYPGTIVIEVLDPIPPGLDRKHFMQILGDKIEDNSTRLVEEARANGVPSPAMPPPVDKSTAELVENGDEG